MAHTSRHHPACPRSTLKRFCRQCKARHTLLSATLYGDLAPEERSWLALLILLRLAVLYFLQSAGRLAGDREYIRHQLEQGRQRYGPDTFYRRVFLPLLKELTHTPEASHAVLSQLALPLLFPLPLESRHLELPDSAFYAVCDLFDSYTWQLDERDDDDESLSPVALALLYEQHIKQKEMGAYYTSADVTNYVTSHTLLPSLFNRLATRLSYTHVHTLLARTLHHYPPSRYLPGALQCSGSLPRETPYEREVRSKRLAELKLALSENKVQTLEDTITYNLDISRLAFDSLTTCEDVEILLAFLDTLDELCVLDPTCGCGAFLYASLALLKDLYMTCLKRLITFASDPRCQGILRRIEYYTNLEHFALANILMHNLYGVELMPGATLICQTRLLLALLACVPVGTPLHLPKLQDHICTDNVLHSDIVIAKSDHETSTTRAETALHWQQAFPDVMTHGGFDVVLGNPPYLELHRTHMNQHSRTPTYSNLYAEVMALTLRLARSDQSYLGLIVPLSICGSARFSSLRTELRQNATELWLANFEIFPCRLFEGAFQRLTLLLARHNSSETHPHQVHVTRLQRWYAAERPHLIELMHYTPLPPQLSSNAFPKLGAPLHGNILHKLNTLPQATTLSTLLAPHTTAYFIYYQEATNYWLKAICQIPYYKKNGVAMPPPHGRYLYFVEEAHARIIMALMNSSLFYLWFATHADGFHLAHKLVKAFPLPYSLLTCQDMVSLAHLLEADILRNANYSTRNTQANAQHTHQGLHIELMEYRLAYSRPLLNQVDELLAHFYGFSSEELEFILHYDDKYRSYSDHH